MSEQIRIVVIGRVHGVYRSQGLITAFQEAGHAVAVADPKLWLSARALRLLQSTGLPRLAGRIAAAGSVLRAALHAARCSFSGDLIWLLPMNADFFAVAYAVKILSRRPLITDLYISYYDTQLDSETYSGSGSLRARYDRAVDRLMIERSDVLLHLSRRELDHIKELVGVKRATVERIVPLGVPTRAVATRRANPEPFRVCWWGSLARVHGIEKIVTAFEILAGRGQAPRLELFGSPWADMKGVRGHIERLGLSDVITVHEGISFDSGELEPFLVERCDLALGLFGDSEKARHALATKIVESFSMGLPVLTMSSPALSEFLDPGLHLFTCLNTAEGIAGAIAEIILDDGERAKRAEEGHRLFQRMFTLERYQASVVAIVEEACGHA